MSHLEAVEHWAAAQNFDLKGTQLECHVIAVWKQDKTTISGTLCDEYEPAIDRVTFLHGTQAVGELSSDDVSVAAKAAMDDFQTALRHAAPIPYLFHTVVEKGEHAPLASAPYRLRWDVLTELVLAEEEIMDGLIDNDDEKLSRGDFRRFKQSEIYAAHPCDEALFRSLRKELWDSKNHVVGMIDYYRSFLNSSKNLNEAGTLTPAAKATLHRVLTAWSASTEEYQKSGVYRNLEIHPRHRSVYDAEIVAFRAENPAGVASASPDLVSPTPSATRSRRPG
jgi:hypothetical protein